MNDFFLVIDIDSGNVAGEYETEQRALDALRDLYDAHGPSAINNYLLMRTDGAGEESLVAAQHDLVRLVLGKAVA